MTAELNQSESQVAKDDIYKNMLIVEGMPNREANTGGDTGQAVYLRNGWDFAEQRAKIDEPFLREARETVCKNYFEYHFQDNKRYKYFHKRF